MTAVEPDLAAGLARVVADGGLESPAVEVVGIASAGATRRTLFLTVESAGHTIPAVAQISGPQLMQVGLSLIHI